MDERAAELAGGNPVVALLPLVIGRWRPGIGDPSFMGWFTVFSYYACAALSLLYLLEARSRMDRTERRFTVAMTGIMFLLGLIKHFNLLSAVTELGRILAQQEGWLESRRLPQLALMIFVAAAFVFFFVRAARSKALARLWRDRAAELVCLTYLCLFVLLRAISLHQYGVLLSREILGVRVNWIAELAGVYALAVVLLVRMFNRKPGGLKERGNV